MISGHIGILKGPTIEPYDAALYPNCPAVQAQANQVSRCLRERLRRICCLTAAIADFVMAGCRLRIYVCSAVWQHLWVFIDCKSMSTSPGRNCCVTFTIFTTCMLLHLVYHVLLLPMLALQILACSQEQGHEK